MSASNTPPNQKRTIFLQAVRAMVECIWTSSFVPEFDYAPANREKGRSYREITASARFRVLYNQKSGRGHSARSRLNEDPHESATIHQPHPLSLLADL